MKVRVVLTIDVDEQAYRDEYGDQAMTAEEIREEIKSAAWTAAATDGIIVPAGIIRSVKEGK